MDVSYYNVELDKAPCTHSRKLTS